MALATGHPAPPAAALQRGGGTPVANALLDVLRDWRVRRIYCCPGSTEAAILDALVTRDDLRLVLVTHESVAVAMAEGDARISGLPAVAYLHTNVGMANGLAHLTSASLSYAPVIVLNGLKAATLAGRRAFTSAEFPHDLVRQYVKWAHTSASPGQVADDADRALHTAVSEPAGPVWLGLPQDLLDGTAPATASVGTKRSAPGPVRPAAAATATAAELLGEAARPVLVAGAGVARRDAADAVITLAERLGAPLLEEGRRDFVASAIPTDHPRYAGRYDPMSPLLAEADVVAYLGCRVFTEFEAPGIPGPPPDTRVLHLHTDPAEVGRLHRVDVALVGVPALALADLLAALPPGPPADPVPLPAAGPAPATTPAGMVPSGTPARFPGHRVLAPAVAALAEAAYHADATVVLDATTATGPLLAGLRTRRPGQLLGSTSGSLGWGLGAALGVAAADPGHPVLCVIGDGTLQFGLPALWTAQRSQLPVTFVVLNNSAYGAVASALHRFGGAATAGDVWPGTDIAGVDVAAVGAAFGLPARSMAATDAALATAVTEALHSGGPALLDVATGTPGSPA